MTTHSSSSGFSLSKPARNVACVSDDPPLPPWWGGYLLRPSRFEFWQNRPNRLHDRFRYSPGSNGAWALERLAP